MEKRTFATLLLAAVIAVAGVSCSRGARVIPARKMEKIYREMFLADQWLADNPDKRKMADTTWFYGPIFEKYGYTVEDYRKSVDRYLSDPKRYAEMMGRVVKDLQEDAGRIDRKLVRIDRMRQRADSLAKALETFTPEDFPYYESLFSVNSMTDRIEIAKNPKGIYFPVPVVEDTVFRGPELIIRDTIPPIAE